MKRTFLKELRFAFAQSIPVMLGYIFLGIAYGLLLYDAGYGFLWAFFTSLIIYAGSMQFVLITLLTSGASLLHSAIMTFFVNGRHIFYGISFIEKFRKMGKAYPYMAFSLTDETYSVLCGLKAPEGYSEQRVSLMIAIMDHSYWVTGSLLGSLVGTLIAFDTTGIDFAMTALFVVIVINQWLESREHRPALIGASVGIVCLALLGPGRFLLPSLAVTSLILLGVRKKWSIR